MSPNVFILMGVAASGKTTIGTALANATNGLFFDGDDFHPESNKIKMSSGQPLTDADRLPWLHTIGKLSAQHANHPQPTFIACSALKNSYREIILSHNPTTTFLFLTAPPEILRQRLTQRQHFMPPSLLNSQLETLEPPANVLTLDTSLPLPQLLSSTLQKLNLPL